ncbi:uncharacterized protein [Halyomorpha halys]|uniref:uncharacterized protein n=1 Tax=Halyomorpha halys TaxID=286706 RepID=UPI0006D4EAC0|nr:uncharacterized protein LOC106688450 [Halyomorpha halys]
MVFDGSFSSELGSLNDHLVMDPELQLDVRHILLNFRRYPCVMASDVCQMYLKILMHPDDVPYQHFLFRFDESEPIMEYQLNRVTFGLSCSTFLAIRVIHQLVLDEGSSYPKASVALKDNI